MQFNEKNFLIKILEYQLFPRKLLEKVLDIATWPEETHRTRSVALGR